MSTHTTPYGNILKIYDYLKQHDFKIITYKAIHEATGCHEWTIKNVCMLLHQLGILESPISQGKRNLEQRGVIRTKGGRFASIVVDAPVLEEKKPELVIPKRLKGKGAKRRLDFMKTFNVAKLKV